jgi:hypothetical protein
MPDIVTAVGIRLVYAQVKAELSAGVGQAGMAWYAVPGLVLQPLC